jgi:hypothetical protein
VKHDRLSCNFLNWIKTEKAVLCIASKKLRNAFFAVFAYLITGKVVFKKKQVVETTRGLSK